MSLRIYKNLSKRAALFQNQLWQPKVLSSRAASDTSEKDSTVNIPSKEKVTNMPPMSEPVPNLPKPVYATLKEEHQKTQVTTLSNGLKVASENRFGEFCTVGVVIDSGSRYEVAFPSGISHFLEKLAFHSTTKYATKDDLMSILENHGGICDSQGARDTFIYAASAYTQGLDNIVHLLGEVVLRPRLSLEEVEAARQAIHFELEMLGMRPEQEIILTDMIHAAGYRDNTLGLPKLCPPPNIHKINRNTLFSYLSSHHRPDRMVLAGVGVEHGRLVEAAEKYFVDEKPIWETEDVLVQNNTRAKIAVDDSVAQYTGGVAKVECDIPQFASAGLPVLSHIVLGLEGCSHQDPDFIPMCVLNMMMGGGGSFSAGGPGKGMYTRLYTNVLNRYHWMYSATAYNYPYTDTGLFCIHASAPPNHVREMVEVIVKEIVAMSGAVSEQELKRAKTQLQSMLLMNLESRPVIFEDIGRQVLTTGHRKRPEYFISEIEKVSEDHIVAVARRLLASQPALAARGELKKLPSLEYIQRGLLRSYGRIPSGRKLSLFS